MSELLSRFIPRQRNPEIPFDQKYGEVNPKGVVVNGYVRHSTAYIQGNVGLFRDGIGRKTRFMIDSGAHVTILMPQDAEYFFKTATDIKKGRILQIDNSKIEGGFFDTEVWLNGKYLGEEVLLAIRLRPFLIKEDGSHRLSSLLGRDVLGQFKKLEIDLTHGKVIFRAGDSGNMKAYRKIS